MKRLTILLSLIVIMFCLEGQAVELEIASIPGNATFTAMTNADDNTPVNVMVHGLLLEATDATEMAMATIHDGTWTTAAFRLEIVADPDGQPTVYVPIGDGDKTYLLFTTSVYANVQYGRLTIIYR